jgi:hypothetical protein
VGRDGAAGGGQKPALRRGEEIHTSKREETKIGGDKQERGKGWPGSANTPSEDGMQTTAPPTNPKRSET